MAPNGTDTVALTNCAIRQPDFRPKDSVDSPPMDLSSTSSTSSSNLPPSSPPPSNRRCDSRNWMTLNLKRESDRRKTFETWTVSFMDPHRLAAAGFYYINQEDLVRCAFCGIEVGRWEEGDDPFKDHQRWSPSCGFIRGLDVGNIPINPNGIPEIPSPMGRNRGRDVCGPFLEIRPFAGPERGMSNGFHQTVMTAEELQKYGINQSRGPVHPNYNTYESRMQSFESWPRSLKQRPEKLSEAGFYYTGKGDQTVCFHCGGGLKDWEETDDPWAEHAVWFPKCIHLVLIKGRNFIEEVRRQKDAKVSVEDLNDLVTENSKSAGDINAPSCSKTVPATEFTISPKQPEESGEKSLDDARVCQICFTEERGVLFLPCGHVVACVKCAPSLSTCAVCRQPFTGTVRAFLS